MLCNRGLLVRIVSLDQIVGQHAREKKCMKNNEVKYEKRDELGQPNLTPYLLGMQECDVIKQNEVVNMKYVNEVYIQNMFIFNLATPIVGNFCENATVPWKL
jgi:hypothetical protein